MTLTGVKTWLGPVLLSLYRPAALKCNTVISTAIYVVSLLHVVSQSEGAARGAVRSDQLCGGGGISVPQQ